jgi:hypothetical protein
MSHQSWSHSHADVSLTCTMSPSLQPVAQVTSPAEYAAGYTAITTKFPSGREQFTTFHPCAAFSSDCVLTAHMYFAWGMHGIIPGARDSLFSVQVSPPQPWEPPEAFLSPEAISPTPAAVQCTSFFALCLSYFSSNCGPRSLCLELCLSAILCTCAADRRPVPVHRQPIRQHPDVPHDRRRLHGAGDLHGQCAQPAARQQHQGAAFSHHWTPSAPRQ